jgi:hypothetical protein
VEVIDHFNNPVEEEGTDMLVLETNDIVDKAVIDTIKNTYTRGITFVEDRLINDKPITDPRKRNKLPLFKSPSI